MKPLHLTLPCGGAISAAVEVGDLDLALLPHVAVDGTEFDISLPKISAVYLLTDDALQVLYVGRASNLWNRWRIRPNFYNVQEIDWRLSHAQLRPALDTGNVSLRWIDVPRDWLAAVEQALILKYGPPWNTHGKLSLAKTTRRGAWQVIDAYRRQGLSINLIVKRLEEQGHISGNDCGWNENMVWEVIRGMNLMRDWAMTISGGENWTWRDIFTEAKRRGDETYTMTDLDEFFPEEAAS